MEFTSKMMLNPCYTEKDRSSGNQDHQDEQGEEAQNDGEEQEEGIYYEEEDPEGQAHHQINQGNDFTFKNQEGNQMRLTKKGLQNPIQKDKRAIEQGLYAHPQPRVLTTAPHLNGQVQQDDNGGQYEEDNQEEIDQEDQFIQETLSEEQRVDTEKIQELFNLFKAGVLGEEDPRLGELHFLLQKYGLTLEDILKQEFLNQANPQNEDNPEDSTLAQVIKVSQSRLEKMKNPKNASVSQTDNIIFEKQKKYQKFLKEYKRDYERKMRSKADNNQGKQERADYKRQRFIEHEDKMLRREYEDEQKSLYYQMRDKKVQYLRNIHKIIFELEKKKIIDEQNEYNENKKTMEEEAKNKLISIENKYKNRIQMLKEGLEQKRKDRHLAEIAQRQELSRQERELKERKRRQIEDLKDLWRAERDKFDMITKDDRKLENEILELYKKY